MARPYPKFTYEDYLLLPEDKRYEIIEGDLMMVPAPNVKHQRLLGNLYVPLRNYVEDKNLGEVFIAPCDVVLSRYDVVQPDLIFVSKERQDIITEKNIQGAPDLVIEILSTDKDRDQNCFNSGASSSAPTEREGLASVELLKKKLYAKYGIKEYWLVDQEAETVEVMELDEKGYRTAAKYADESMLTSLAFRELHLKLADVFKTGKP